MEASGAMTTSDKAAIKEALVSRTPDQWLDLIREKIPDDEMRRWMANLICWNHPQEMGRHERLVIFSEGIIPIKATSKELEAAHHALGLPYVRSKNDSAMPSAKKHEIRHERIVNSQAEGHPEAWRYQRFHEKETKAG